MSWSSNGLALVRDERIAPVAVSRLPAWLWSLDASRILWANPTGAAIFGAATSTGIAARKFDAGQPAAAQIARLAATLPADGAPQPVRLRGFGAGIGRALTCRCSRITLSDGSEALLVAAVEPAGRDLTLDERVRRLLADCDQPIAVFSIDGEPMHVSAGALCFVRGGRPLGALGIESIARDALSTGHATGRSRHGMVRIDRLGEEPESVLLAAFADPCDAEIATVAASEAAIALPFEPAPVQPAISRPPAPQVFRSEPQATAAVAETAPVHVAAPATTVQLNSAPETIAATAVETAPAEAATSAEREPAAVSPVAAAAETSVAETAVAAVVQPALPTPREPALPYFERRHPLRFVWQIDAEGRFTLGSSEFIALAGPATAAALGRTWADFAAELGLDSEQHIAQALATRDTWSGLTVDWPIDGSADRLTVELSGLPSFDRERQFRGYRGFGVVRDIARLNDLARTHNVPGRVPAEAANPIPELPSPPASPVEMQPAESETPTLSAVEHHAFYELSRRLTHLNHDDAALDRAIAESDSLLSPAGDMRQLFDRLPVGILIYRLEDLIYANPAFLRAVDYDSLDELIEAGGLDRILIAPDSTSVAPPPGKPSALTMVDRGGEIRLDIELIPVLWESEAAHALLIPSSAGTAESEAADVALEREQTADDEVVAPQAQAGAAPLSAVPVQAQAAAATSAEVAELQAILDTATDGVVVLDRTGSILSANSGAAALFGYGAGELTGRPFVDLFAPESVSTATTCLHSVSDGGAAGTLSGRDVTGRARQGGDMRLSMTLGRIGADADKVCAVFRDVTPWKKVEEELLAAKHEAEKASSAKSELLAKISHEIRTPLNAIIGFSEVMMEERFGAIANDRYRDYVNDIHAAGGHLISLINDLLDLSKIEAGKLDLNLDRVSLNDLAQQCAALMLPQASRRHIIMRTSLPPVLPHVVADARSVRQIVLNLLSNSIKFTEAGGQVIVSTALDDQGGVVLRVRDSGIGMDEADIATALEPFRQIETTIAGRAGGTGLGLPLTKALAEANGALFRIRSAPKEGTLVEIVFEAADALAG